jgi:DNA polymerase/3'-5' exonuclease PolX
MNKMKVFELLYVFNIHLNESMIKYPSNKYYISSAYANVSKKLTDVYNCNKILTNSDIMKLKITEHMKIKLKSILTQKINLNELKIITKKFNHIKLINDLIDFAGIGKVKAESLVKSGLTKLSELKNKKYECQLNDSTKLLMKYKPTRKIQHNDIKKLDLVLTKFPNTKIVGGFRRKKSHSKDIDIMLVSDNENSLDKYLKYLENNFDEMYVYAKGTNKVSLIILINNKNVYFKIDIFRTSVDNKYAMLLYTTGSKEFNIKMRSTAIKMNYLLNQTGIYKVQKNIPNKTPIKVKSEKDFFNILGMDYIKPQDR